MLTEIQIKQLAILEINTQIEILERLIAMIGDDECQTDK